MKCFPIRHHIKTISYENTIPFTPYRFVRKRHSVNEALIFKSNMNTKPSNAHVWDIKKESIGYNRHASPLQFNNLWTKCPFCTKICHLCATPTCTNSPNFAHFAYVSRNFFHSRITRTQKFAKNIFKHFHETLTKLYVCTRNFNLATREFSFNK